MRPSITVVSMSQSAAITTPGRRMAVAALAHPMPFKPITPILTRSEGMTLFLK